MTKQFLTLENEQKALIVQFLSQYLNDAKFIGRIQLAEDFTGLDTHSLNHIGFGAEACIQQLIGDVNSLQTQAQQDAQDVLDSNIVINQ